MNLPTLWRPRTLLIAGVMGLAIAAAAAYVLVLLAFLWHARTQASVGRVSLKDGYQVAAAVLRLSQHHSRHKQSKYPLILLGDFKSPHAHILKRMPIR